MAQINVIGIYKLEQLPNKKPKKKITAEVLTAALEELRASDFGLFTITDPIQVTSQETNYVAFGSVNSYGSPNNYAKVDIAFIGTAGAPVRATGSHKVSVEVIGF